MSASGLTTTLYVPVCPSVSGSTNTAVPGTPLVLAKSWVLSGLAIVYATQQVAPVVLVKLNENDSAWPAVPENVYAAAWPRTGSGAVTGPPPSGRAPATSGGTFQTSTEAVPVPLPVGATSSWSVPVMGSVSGSTKPLP